MADARDQPLKVIIVGAGIGGLTAGLAFRQQGHHVTLLESSRFSNEVGAAIHVAPNCNGLLLRLGLDIETVGANEFTGMNMYNPEGDCIQRMDMTEFSKLWQHKYLFVHRAHLHTALRERAMAEKGRGKPCELKLASKVVSIDPENATVTLATGETIVGDVVLGADGVHSECRKALAGEGKDYKPFDSGHSAYRSLIPMKDLHDDPLTKELTDTPGYLVLNMGTDRRLICYPCVNNTVMNIAMIHPSDESRVEGSDWNQKGDKKRMLEIAASLSDNFRAILEKSPEDTLKVWTLLDLEQLPEWVNGRMALLGDAAHPFLPHQAQGGAQAIEDAISLAALLPLGTPKEDIHDRLTLYQKCRHHRASRIQHLTRITGMSVAEQKKRGIEYNPLEFLKYNFNHDEWDSSTHALAKHLATKHPYRYRQPLSFGPSPGPRQPLGQMSDTLSYAEQHQIVHAVRFKSSATYLRTLFPNENFSFSSPGTFAQASFICCSLKHMTWLGGRGYNHCGLYIHGVCYTKSTGEKVHGTFLPVLFEDSIDPIVTGRDELGMPKLGCEIAISEIGAGRKVTLSSGGNVFGSLSFDDLTESETEVVPKPEPDHGMLMYRYVPAVGEPGKADAEYAVFDPYTVPVVAEAEDPVVSEARKNFGEKKVAGTSRVEFQGLDWERLPTLHHVARGLAEVPVHEVLEAKVEFVGSVGDVRGARRIE